MAKLTSGHLTLEIAYRKLDLGGWVHYDIRFLFDDQPLINPALLSLDKAFRANEYEQDTLIPAIDQALQSRHPLSWEPLEPDIAIQFYPDGTYPYAPAWLFPARQEPFENWPQPKSKPDTEPLEPDDDMTLLVMMDAYNFERSQGYTRDGPALILSVTRADLQAFRDTLQVERDIILPRLRKGRK
jgi:hypothetical protein